MRLSLAIDSISNPSSLFLHDNTVTMSGDNPLISHIFTADPSAHTFPNHPGKIFLYPSHDVDAGIEDNDNGDQYAMNDYHVFSMPSAAGPVTDHGVALKEADVPW